MDLTMTQCVLARLFTDATLRDRFLANPEAFGKEVGLEQQQMSEFAQLPARQVAFFADSLIRKRLGEVCKLLPLTRKALGVRFDTLFRRFAESHRLEMPKPHQRDATAFCGFLKELAGSEFSEAPWALDAARFDASCLEALAPGRRAIIRLLRYPIPELLRSATEADRVPRPVPRPTLGVWVRFSPRGRLRFFTLSLPRLPQAGKGVGNASPEGIPNVAGASAAPAPAKSRGLRDCASPTD